MSRAYRVTVKGSVHRVVHVEDGVCSDLDLLPILPERRTAELLASDLERRGFVREGDVARRVESDGVIVEVDVAKRTVNVKAEATAAIDVERQNTTSVYEEQLEAGRERAQKQADREAERDAAAAEEKARQDVTGKLERKIRDLREELDQVVGRVTAAALKEKAAQLGEIQEMVEDEATGELTIKVKL